MNLKIELTKMAKLAKDAASRTSSFSSTFKNKVLTDLAAALLEKKDKILEANKMDLRKARAKGLSASFLDRLKLDEKRIQQMAQTLREIARLPDPVGAVIKSWRRPNGLWIKKVRVPIGVIAIIYEARPNVTAECLGLCFKSGNSLILRGGSEALRSNLAIYAVLKNVLQKQRLCGHLVNMINTANHRAVRLLLTLSDYIDLVMPRGGEGLIKEVARLSRIPVIKHYKGICHVYVDSDADLRMAQNICFNAKVQRPGVCNAMECMLVHKDIAVGFLPEMLKKFKTAGVEIRGCALTRKIGKDRTIKLAKDRDYHSEYLDLILSVKVVAGLEEAIQHINTYGSHHSDTIVTQNKKSAAQFLRRVDSACVYCNASTRFTDGYQFGLGAEIGISTDKLHARGPMALEELTTYKYLVYGNGQVRRS